MKIQKKLKIIRNILIQFYYGLRHKEPSTYLMLGSDMSQDFIIGEYGFIARGAAICSNVEFGKYVMVGPSLHVVGSDHLYQKLKVPVIFSGRPEQARTVIGDDVWIASRVTILAGVRIGSGAIVAAGSIVTKDVAEFSIVAGNPARIIGYRFDKNERAEHLAAISGFDPDWKYADRR